jgi:hypothetical protein
MKPSETYLEIQYHRHVSMHKGSPQHAMQEQGGE